MNKLLCIISVLLLCLTSVALQSELKIVTTTADLADIARNIGGASVIVESLSNGRQDPHFVEPRPSMVVTLRAADLVVLLGMDLDIWCQSLIDASKNPAIKKGSNGYLDASAGVEKKEIPTGKVDWSMGHVHPHGNPHYWLDPENGKLIASEIAERLSLLDPDRQQVFQENLHKFSQQIDERMKTWKMKFESLKNKKLVSYHASWIYFADRFGLTIVDELEPKPGISPSLHHLEDVIKTMKAENVKTIVIEVYYDEKPARFAAQHTGATVVKVANSVGGSQGAVDYIRMIDSIVSALMDSMR